VFQKRIEQFLIPLFDMRDGELMQVCFGCLRVFDKFSVLEIFFQSKKLVDKWW